MLIPIIGYFPGTTRTNIGETSRPIVQRIKILAALNLAFYLASFGMYSRRADLLDRDYKVLVPAVELLRKESRNGWEDCIFSQSPGDELASKLNQLSIKFRKQLTPTLARPRKPAAKIRVSDTLLSKIMLVTLQITFPRSTPR